MASGAGGKKPRRRSSRGGSSRRRRRYVSVRRCLETAAAVEEEPPSRLTPPSSPQIAGGQLELFPIFDAAPSLTDILGCADTSSSAAAVAGGDCTSLGSPDVAGGGEDEEEDLAKRALRGRERWAYCHSSASPSASDEAASAPAAAAAALGLSSSGAALWLKLDYDEVLTAWSDRGSLYMDCDAGDVVGVQLVPTSPLMVETGASLSWTVPDCNDTKKKGAAVRDESVRRYREKRERRLFAKRVRYEVRKLNAEKRPRFKGRFVKANEET